LRSRLELVFKTHYEELCILANSYLHSFSEAEDVVQDVFVKLLLKGNIDEIGLLEHYIKRAIKNACLKKIRDRKAMHTIDGAVIREENFFEKKESELHEERRNSLLLDELNKLPEQCRKVFLMCVVEELTYQKTADKLNISVNTVKSQVKKAYKVLRNAMGMTLLKAIAVVFYFLF